MKDEFEGIDFRSMQEHFNAELQKEIDEDILFQMILRGRSVEEILQLNTDLSFITEVAFKKKEYKFLEKLIINDVPHTYIEELKDMTKDQAIKYLRYIQIKWKK